MDDREMHLAHLRAGEGQFRLATAARLAVTMGHQPLDLPIQWSHGKHLVNYSEIALTKDEAGFAAWNLERSATFLMASAVLEAIRGTTQNPKSDADAHVVNAYQVARRVSGIAGRKCFAWTWTRYSSHPQGRVVLTRPMEKAGWPLVGCH